MKYIGSHEKMDVEEVFIPKSQCYHVISIIQGLYSCMHGESKTFTPSVGSKTILSISKESMFTVDGGDEVVDYE